MPLNIYFSHSLGRNDYKLFRDIFNQAKEHGLDIAFVEGETSAGPISPAVQEAIAKADIVLAFLSRKGMNLTRVLEETQLARRNQKKVLIVAERGLQAKEIQDSKNVIPFDARYPIDTVKRSVSIVRDLRLKREDAERVKGLVGVMVFLKVLAYFSDTP